MYSTSSFQNLTVTFKIQDLSFLHSTHGYKHVPHIVNYQNGRYCLEYAKKLHISIANYLNGKYYLDHGRKLHISDC